MSFGARSFPRSRESTPLTSGNVRSSDWIPAFAGMTGGSSGCSFQMTPVPLGTALGCPHPGCLTIVAVQHPAQPLTASPLRSAKPCCSRQERFPTYPPPHATCRALTAFIFNNIPALDAYLLCFHQHSRLAPGCGMSVLCFHRHSRFVPSKKNFLSRLIPNFEFGVVCHPEPAMLSGGRRISAVALCVQHPTANCRDASLRAA